jgi:hypothetical protein
MGKYDCAIFILKESLSDYVKKEFLGFFWHKMMVKSGLEKYFKIPPFAKLLSLLHKTAQNYKFSNKNDLFFRMEGFQKKITIIF